MDVEQQEEQVQEEAPVVEIGEPSAPEPSALDAALIREAALQQVLARHNIRVNLDSVDLSPLSVQDGKVVGEVAYSPPGVSNRLSRPESSYRQPPARQAQAAAPASQPLSLDDVAKWTPQEVNSRWDEVQALLKD